MGVKANFNMQNIRKKLDEAKTKKENDIIRVLSFLGEKCVNDARQAGSYTDRTSNLRNSTGYVVLKDGQEVFESFDGDTQDGRKNAREVATKVSVDYPDGIVLIVVAGMNYAAYVESKGFNVLTSTERFAEVESKRMLERLFS